jgi:hypothetical protein
MVNATLTLDIASVLVTVREPTLPLRGPTLGATTWPEALLRQRQGLPSADCDPQVCNGWHRVTTRAKYTTFDTLIVRFVTNSELVRVTVR